MPEYIERDKALQAIENMKRPGKALTLMYLQEIPAADYVYIGHGGKYPPFEKESAAPIWGRGG